MTVSMHQIHIDKILRLKSEKQALILAHNYQRPEIQDIADVVGDSLELSRRAAESDAPLIIFCGVYFMAETAKILSPDKTVLLPRLDAGCPMADMADAEGLRRLKVLHPKAAVVTYVNSTAEVKAESDVCCTSANAVDIVKRMEAKEIIFSPDRNLASFVQRFTDKTIIPWNGYCHVHELFTTDEVLEARRRHPDAVVMVHPECPSAVVDRADETLSTSGMLRFARQSDASEFLVGTEEGLLHRLKKENPDKRFHSIGAAKLCPNMKKTSLADLASSLELGRYAITVPDGILQKARQALERMIQ
jgi:quinolinate synthase